MIEQPTLKDTDIYLLRAYAGEAISYHPHTEDTVLDRDEYDDEPVIYASKLAAVVRGIPGMCKKQGCEQYWLSATRDCWVNHPSWVSVGGDEIIRAFAPLLDDGKKKGGKGGLTE